MSLADQVSGAGDGGGRAIKQYVLQFCLKSLVKKCKELLWFVSCSHMRVRMEDVSLQRSVLLPGSRCLLLFGTVTWRGAVHFFCDLWNVPPCPPLSSVCL